MALSPRLIRRRIRSVHNTKKITKAMELVAAAKMRRAVAAALKTRAYAKLAWGMVEALHGTAGEVIHPLLRQSKTGVTNFECGRTRNMSHGGCAVLYVVMASDRGLCGGFNAALFREVVKDVHAIPTPSSSPSQGEGEKMNSFPTSHRERFSPFPKGGARGGARADAQGRRGGVGPIRFVTIGKKAEQFVRRMSWNLVASFTNLSVAPTVAELRPIAKLAMDAFSRGEVDEVRVAFTDFISSLRQQPRVRTLLPLQRIEEVGIRAETSTPSPTSPRLRGTGRSPSHGEGEKKNGFPTSHREGGHGGVGTTEFLFEPSPAIVLNAMLPRLVELQVYQCYLETGASEHSARMLAMRSASDAAKDMIDDLTLTFNQARQSLITREIAEISAGRAALTPASS